ncbi:MAG: ferric reductase-like transmembrane domain-containing protein [Ilumatobacteraceae bacterium]
MNSEFWWYVARASGIVGWLLLTASVIWGILLASDLLARWRRPAWLLDLHRALAGLTVGFVAVHVGALIADSYVHFDLVDVLVPFASEWKTGAVALGVMAFWGLAVVQATSLAMRRLQRRVWRGIHLTSYAAFLLTSLHGTFAGTDATNVLYVATSIVTTAALIFAVTYRVLARRRPRSRSERPAAVAGR